MPKPTMEAMLPDAAVESTGSFAGKFEVLGSVYAVHKDKEYELKPGEKPKTNKDGNPVKNEPMMALVFKVTPISDDGERLEDADTRDIILKLGGKSLAIFHPGKGSNADDDDPEDLGTDINTTGNTLYIPPEAKVEMNAKSGYTVFMKSLQHKGFPKEKIAESWAPNFKGLKFELVTVGPEKLEAYGSAKGEKSQFTYKVVENIIAMPKGVKGGKAAAPKEDDEEAPKKAAPKKAAKKAAADDDDDDAPVKGTGAGAGDPEAEASRVLASVVAKLAGKTKDLEKVKVFWVTNFSDPKVKGNAKLMDAARKIVNDDVWLKKALKAAGCKVVTDGEDVTVTFPDEDDE